MNKTFWVIWFVTVTMLFVAGCGEEASWETQEQSRQAALENAEHNARLFRDATFPETRIYMRGDSTISSKCPQGDGWATVDLLHKKGREIVTRLKCSTVSESLGCMQEVDFKSRKAMASQDGRCNNEIPFPLPKIVK